MRTWSIRNQMRWKIATWIFLGLVIVTGITFLLFHLVHKNGRPSSVQELTLIQVNSNERRYRNGNSQS